MDSDVIQQYVAMGLGVGIVASMAAEQLAPGLHAIRANHLFAPNVTRVAVRRGAFLREYAVDFIRQLAPKLSLQELAGRGNGATQREAFKDRIRDYIGQHLRDPALSIDRIAEVLRCSKRHLHQAFADEEVTLTQFILQRRLQACMRDLRNPQYQPRTITDIAFSWGFNNGAHFSRVFREHAGLSPSDFRSAALPH